MIWDNPQLAPYRQILLCDGTSIVTLNNPNLLADPFQKQLWVAHNPPKISKWRGILGEGKSSCVHNHSVSVRVVAQDTKFVDKTKKI